MEFRSNQQFYRKHSEPFKGDLQASKVLVSHRSQGSEMVYVATSGKDISSLIEAWIRGSQEGGE